MGQCRAWLRKNVPDADLMDVVSTAEAVRTAKKRDAVAAVAGVLSAQRYGVPIQARGIQDRDDNVTRFLIVGKTEAKPLGEGQDKTSLVISLRDEVGALEENTSCFCRAWH